MASLYCQLKKKVIQLIANVSTFLGDLGLVVKNPKTGNITVIEVSAQDHMQCYCWKQSYNCQGQTSHCKGFQHSKHHS